MFGWNKKVKNAYDVGKRVKVELIEEASLGGEYEFVMIKDKKKSLALRNKLSGKLSSFRFDTYRKLNEEYFVATIQREDGYSEELIIDGSKGSTIGGTFDRVACLQNGQIIVKLTSENEGKSFSKPSPKFDAEYITTHGWTVFDPKTEKTMRLRFAEFKEGTYNHEEWTAAYLNNKEYDGVYFNRSGKLMRPYPGADPYRFVEVTPFANKYFAFARTAYKTNPYVFVYVDGKTSAERFDSIEYVFDNENNLLGAKATFDGKTFMEVGKRGEVTTKSWLDLIAKDPANFQYIPTVRFMDEEFVMEARKTAMTALDKKLRAIKVVTEEDIKEFETLVGEIDVKIQKETANVEVLKQQEAKKLAEEEKRRVAEMKALEERRKKETDEERIAREAEEENRKRSLENKKAITDILTRK